MRFLKQTIAAGAAIFFISFLLATASTLAGDELTPIKQKYHSGGGAGKLSPGVAVDGGGTARKGKHVKRIPPRVDKTINQIGTPEQVPAAH